MGQCPVHMPTSKFRPHLSANYLRLHSKQWKDTGKYSTLNDSGIWLHKIDKFLFSYHVLVGIGIKTQFLYSKSK